MATASRFFFNLFTLTLSVQAMLHLETTDHAALLVAFKDLGAFTGSNNICNDAGVFCEQRIFNGTTVLRVTRIVLKHRSLNGSISPAIGKLPELIELSLPYNHLVNEIPPQITECRKLEALNLQSNRFSGKVPSGLSSLVRLRILDLSSNELSGDLNFLKYFPNLEKLSLDNNMFTGKVPTSLWSFRNLRFFNISGNSFLEGSIPMTGILESPSTNNNKFVQKRYILAKSNSTTNKGVNSGNYQAPAPSLNSELIHKHKNKKKRVIHWIIVCSVGALALIISGTLTTVLLFRTAVWVYNTINKIGIKNDFGPTMFSNLIKAKELVFLKKDDRVASLQIIGRGGCGVVYKTELQESEIKTIAIKKVLATPKEIEELTNEETKLLNRKMRQIKSEIKTVGKIRHPNLLPLLAHVSRPNCHYLVYEFMNNGSLQDILQQVKDGTRELDWLARHKIALGVAAGLEYLHMSHTPRIVHRDLKPANILLDDDMGALITDFGLAKAIPDTNTHMTSSNVSGILGYIAPEYHQTLKVTEKCDIYSFGVLLATLVMGKLPSDEFFINTYQMGLVEWMRNALTGKDPKQVIDPSLMGNGYEEQMLLVLKIACFCTHNDPKARPGAKDVRLMLVQIHQ